VVAQIDDRRVREAIGDEAVTHCLDFSASDHKRRWAARRVTWSIQQLARVHESYPFARRLS
jgi:hypothetical protein